MTVREHKIIIGDSRDMKEVEDESVHLVVTSPPYYGAPMWDKLLKSLGVEYIGPAHQKRRKLSREEVMSKNKQGEQVFHDFLGETWKECWRVLVPGARCAINVMNVHNSTHGMWMNTLEVTKRMTDLGFVLREEVIWNKLGMQHKPPMGSAHYPWGSLLNNLIEYILIFQKPGKRDVSVGTLGEERKEGSRLKWRELREWTDNNVWVFKSAHATREKHMAPFPLELPWRVIKLWSYKEDVVLDPFLGSGTTTKAAKLLRRNSVGYEIDESFLGVIKEKIGAIQQTAWEEQDKFTVIRQGVESTLDVSLTNKELKRRQKKKKPKGFRTMEDWLGTWRTEG